MKFLCWFLSHRWKIVRHLDKEEQKEMGGDYSVLECTRCKKQIVG